MIGPKKMTIFTLHSQDIVEGQLKDKRFSFNSFGHDGDNVSPQLSWENAPEGTKSFAITCFDPDAPTESGFWHWQVINIPASTTSIDQGASGKLAAGLEMRNDYGFNGYGGACPPEGHGMHRYQFTVWALPVEKLEVPDDASCALVSFMLNATALGKSTITPTYVR
ncbi:kinase inhibitor [Photobacterium angustum]|nr:kinase inhibitor [Photobacterium damselae subsp. damselae]KJG03206.1 kinase inhibitor [Photobacterium angustum]KJG39901.1 kinase inhibitor [Photobacterium angustum]KJG43170.1 kinase inhibitor [Photobacterium angustum]KJG47977.1 kinase inhibitor [Photobacterium angustum]